MTDHESTGPGDRRPPRPGWPRPSAAAVRDLRGGVRLMLDGVRAGLDRLERAHRRLAEVDPPVRGTRLGRPGSAMGSVPYRLLRGTTDVLGGGLDLALATVQAALLQPQRVREGAAAPSPARESAVAALNGLVGDHLHRTDNPLAIGTRLHARGPLQTRALVLVHDFGLGELHWRQGGHDHGEALAAALHATPVYAQYNSGRHVHAVARELAAELESLLGRWAVPLQGVALLGHGLGGLVLRSALLQASRAGTAWPAHVRQLVFLGTPHHGAEVGGATRQLASLAGAQSLLAPLARLARRRSSGLCDFLEGALLERDGRTNDLPQHATIGLPANVASYAIAGAVGDGHDDGWVSVASALGQHPVATRDLQIPPARRWTVQGVDHLGLLGSQAVFQKVRQWLAE
jgi:hypothetical protein